MVIWKFPLSWVQATNSPEFPTMIMPNDARILTLQVKDYIPTLWVLVNPENDLYEYRFQVVGTGHEVPDGVYIGTWQDDFFVWHLFEIGGRA